jgi:hypothetical protein
MTEVASTTPTHNTIVRAHAAGRIPSARSPVSTMVFSRTRKMTPSKDWFSGLIVRYHLCFYIIVRVIVRCGGRSLGLPR